MTANKIINCFARTACPVAMIGEGLDIVAANDSAKSSFEPIFTQNGLKDYLSSEEAVEIEYKLRTGENAVIRPKNGIFKGCRLEFIPTCGQAEDHAALLIMTDTDRDIVKDAPEGEQYYMARFFEPQIRDAVASIFSNTDMIRNSQDTVLTDKAEESLENISCEAYRVLRWADHVRLITALSTGELEYTSSDIMEFSKSLIGAAKIMLRGYAFLEDYRTDTESKSFVCSFDREAMTRAILCLISNACKAVGRGGAVKTFVTVTDTDYRFTVTNGGAYIPAHLISHVTEPYFSYKNSNEDTRGIGLGLAIAKAVAEKHGGRLFLQSSQEYGTTVMLRIPVTLEPNAPAFLGQSAMEYLTDRYSPLFVELYGF